MNWNIVLGDGTVREFTWRQAVDEAKRMAAHLISLDLPRSSNVAIFAKNNAWWFMSDLAIWMAGHVSVPLYATLSAQDIAPGGDAGGVFAGALFSDELGQATVYLPVSTPFRATGRVEALELPPAELAVIAHSGPHDNIDRAYGALADHVTRHALAIEGPIREFYPVNRHHTGDSARWRTEIGWPIFETAPR